MIEKFQLSVTKLRLTKQWITNCERRLIIVATVMLAGTT